MGNNGLYTNTLFRFNPTFFNLVSPAIELGRSFIRLEYQRSFHALMLLWRGIGQFIVCYPYYRYLYGPVSISNNYSFGTQSTMMMFLKTHHWNPEISQYVKPRNPFLYPVRRQIIPSRTTELEQILSDMEGESCGLPVLIRQYLRLSGEFVCFNRDPEFSNVLDGLMVVDLLQTSSRHLSKYMGETGLNKFYERHKLNKTSNAILRRTN